MECKYCGGIVRALYPGGMRGRKTQCDNCGRYNCEKEVPEQTEVEKACERLARTGSYRNLKRLNKAKRNNR